MFLLTILRNASSYDLSPQHALLRSHLCARTRRTAPELPAAVPGLLAAPRFRQHPHSCAPHPRTPRTPLAAVIACSSVQRARRPRLRTRSHTSSSSRAQYSRTRAPYPVPPTTSTPSSSSHRSHTHDPARTHTSSFPHVLRCPVSALTPDYVWPPPLRPLVFAQISHARPRATPQPRTPRRGQS